MPRFIDWLGGVLGELRRRNVLHVAAVYAVGAWVVLQVAAITFPALFFPRWALTLVIVLAILGFPVALTLAWRYDIGEDGLRRVERLPSFTGDGEPTKRGVAVVLLLVGVVATAGAGWTALRAWTAVRDGTADGRPPTATGDRLDPHRIAVLPFEDHSSEGELGGIAAGLTGDLIQELDRVEGLELVSFTGVKPFREPDITLDSIARLLRAGTIVEGSVERSGERLAISANLVDGNTDTRIGSVRIEEPRGNLLSLRSELVDRVARELRRTLGTRIERRELRAETDDERAWRLFHEAQETARFADTLGFRGDTASARRLYDEADSLLAVADTLDPGWVEPAVRRAWVALDLSELGAETTADWDTVWLRRADSLASRALAREPGDAAALEARGAVRHQASQVPGFDRAWATLDSAEFDLRRAVAEDPDRARAWAELSQLLEAKGLFGEARMAARRSREADPFLGHDLQYLWATASLALQLEQFDAVERLARRGRRLFPDETAWDVFHLTALAGPRGPDPKPDTAWALLRAYESAVGGQVPPGRLLVAASLARAGLEDSARAVLRRAKEAAPDHPFTHYNGANVHLQLGEPDSAVALLARYLEARPDERARLAQEWWFEALHGREDFRRLVTATPESGSTASP